MEECQVVKNAVLMFRHAHGLSAEVTEVRDFFQINTALNNNIAPGC